MTGLRQTCTELARAELRRRAAGAELARRSLGWFVRLAIAAGVVDGIQRVEWGPHLDAICSEVQAQLEGWLVAYGLGTAEMVARQRAAWERTGATWEDGALRPWERYVLVQNAVDNLPPGTLKSTIVMVCANAWIWLWAPRFSFGALSGIDANVGRDSRACRELVRSSWYRETFAIAWTDVDADPEAGPADLEIKRDTDAVEAWATTAGGKRLSRTVTRGLTGTHVDGIYLDDADDADRVHNEAERLRPQNRWTRAIETRVNDDHRSIRRVMQQIVHVEGFTAYLLSIARWSPQTPKGWAQLCIPAEYGYGPPDAPAETPYGWRDWRTTKGDTMHPRLSPGVLADWKLKLPAYEAVYNQNAERITDGDFKRTAARFFVFEGETVTRKRPEGCASRSDLPARVVKRSDLDRWTLNVDTAGSLDPTPSSKGSAVGLVVAACSWDDRFVVDDRTRMLGPQGTYLAIYELIGAWEIERILVEFKTIGAGVIGEIERSIKRGWYLDAADRQVPLLGPDGRPARCVVEPFNPGKDSKEQRWQGMLPSWRQGETYLRDGADWLYPVSDENRRTIDEGFIGEICGLPHSRRNERADMLAQHVMFHRAAKPPPRSSGGFVFGPS
jgi:hypothetical protein